MPPKDKGEEKRKKKDARKALLAFLKRLRRFCKGINSLEDWQEMTQALTDLLKEHAGVIPSDHSQGLMKALASGQAPIQSAGGEKRPAKAIRSGVGGACKVLEKNLGRLIKALPGGGSLAGVVVGGLIMVAVAVGIIAGLLEYTAIEVTIVNNGCSTIVLPSDLPFPVPGLSLPGPIPPGRSGAVKIPWVIRGEVDATRSEDIIITVAGSSIHYDLGPRIRSIKLDGQEIIGRRVFIDLGRQRQHELIISCR